MNAALCMNHFDRAATSTDANPSGSVVTVPVIVTLTVFASTRCSDPAIVRQRATKQMAKFAMLLFIPEIIERKFRCGAKRIKNLKMDV
jgi:hypothetical protein